jgi:hypothetical protein
VKPCIHLDHEDGKFTDCTLEDCAPHYPDVKFWRRGEVWLDRDESGRATNPEKVQFCKLRGRINGIFGCYNGEMCCYEPAAPAAGREEG